MTAALRPARFLSAPAAALAGLLLAAPGGAQQAGPGQDARGQGQGGAPYVIVETGQGFASLQQAVDAIGDGQGAIAIAPGNHAQCAVQTAGVISYLAVEPGSAIFDGTTCEGKAALVLRGRGAQVAGLVFQNMRVADHNGAGIRLETGDLTVAESWFRDSQQGILTANDMGGRIVIDRSTFTRLGTCEGAGGCAHSIYTGEYGQLRVTRTRFEQGRGGHYLKSRAATVEIAASSFDDAGGRATNYMIDLPGGASGRISNNWFVQGRDKENYSAFIAVAAEGAQRPSAALAVVGNDARLAPGVERETVFVADWSGDMRTIGDNRLGRGLTRYQKR